MKVARLIELLEELPQDLEVFVSRDSEGNSFSKASEDPGVYLMDSDNEVFNLDDVDDPEVENLSKVVVIWPTR